MEPAPRPTIANGVRYRLRRQEAERDVLERIKDLEDAVAVLRRLAWFIVGGLLTLASTAGAAKLIAYL